MSLAFYDSVVAAPHSASYIHPKSPYLKVIALNKDITHLQHPHHLPAHHPTIVLLPPLANCQKQHYWTHHSYIWTYLHPILPPGRDKGTLDLWCTNKNYILLYESGVLPSHESKISVSYNLRVSALKIQACTSRIPDTSATWFSDTIQASHLKDVSRKLNYWYNTTHFSRFLELWELTTKQPDIAIISPENDHWSSVMVEVGWSQKYKDLLESANIWLLGGRSNGSNSPGEVNVVLLIDLQESWCQGSGGQSSSSQDRDNGQGIMRGRGVSGLLCDPWQG
ncbi:hypothetical protein BV22DRAFT_1051915 [Leucogyrophana mollusca]|uniref:Uncharacterized protein n=1 Tax=Leucogyrophana mollusca TaxID=85980 RepID=A0ACB8AZ79_9AGAM|nr:hypothetical protein BV22DRAFT_1051915 [Leucogyrophana mollusca]